MPKTFELKKLGKFLNLRNSAKCIRSKTFPHGTFAIVFYVAELEDIYLTCT